jgi:hypothetical protein
MISIVMSAELSGKQVKVSVDDTRKDSGGSCFARWVMLLPG